MAELGLVDPPHDALPVGQDRGGNRDVLSRVAPALQEVEAAEELPLLVGEEREPGREILAESRRDSGRIRAHRDDADTEIVDPLLEFLELPELTGTEQSEVAPVEDVERRCPSLLDARFEGPAFGIREGELGERVAGRDGDLPGGKAFSDREVANDDGKRR